MDVHSARERVDHHIYLYYRHMDIGSSHQCNSGSMLNGLPIPDSTCVYDSSSCGYYGLCGCLPLQSYRERTDCLALAWVIADNIRCLPPYSGSPYQKHENHPVPNLRIERN